MYLGSACIDAFGWRATFLVYGLLEGLLALPLLYACAAHASRRAARSDARPGLALGGLLADRRQPDPRRVRRHWRDGAWRAAVAGGATCWTATTPRASPCRSPCWRRSGCCSCSLADRRRCSGARCS
uniref:hypothetical protein n=1 Tax=Pseudomonas aeruginosa TaxID=287 RepID=UPI00339DCFAF